MRIKNFKKGGEKMEVSNSLDEKIDFSFCRCGSFEKSQSLKFKLRLKFGRLEEWVWVYGSSCSNCGDYKIPELQTNNKDGWGFEIKDFRFVNSKKKQRDFVEYDGSLYFDPPETKKKTKDVLECISVPELRRVRKVSNLDIEQAKARVQDKIRNKALRKREHAFRSKPKSKSKKDLNRLVSNLKPIDE